MQPAFLLPALMDLRAAAPLKAELQSRVGVALELDAAQVERVGGLCAQVLIAAAAAWSASGQALRVINPSAAFRDDMRRLGAAPFIPGSDASC